MIFGKTGLEKRQAEQDRIKKFYNTRIRIFAWFPHQLNNQRWIWMQYVYKEIHVYKLWGMYEFAGYCTYHLNESGYD